MDLVPDQPQPGRFYDGGLPPAPPRPDLPAVIMLERLETGEGSRRRETFRMLRRIGYRDDVFGEIVVPTDPATFETDFASVPTLFTWLVPKTGAHLPAALIHDGMVGDGGSPDYVATGFPDDDPIDRVAADAVLRRAMRDSGIDPVRQWLVWSAVTLGTIWHGSSAWSRVRHLRYLVAALGTVLVIAGLGALATLDLFDVVDLLPWMGERPFLLELVGGLAGAIVVPLLLGLTWGRFAVAGVVGGIALATLLHVTVAILGVTALYQVAECIARRWPIGGSILAGCVTAASLVLTVVLISTAGSGAG